MSSVLSLWLPIVVSALLVFLVSSLIHMATPWHRGEYPKLPDENAFMDAVRPLRIAPGDYMVPRAGSVAEMKSAEFRERTARGPVMILTVRPNGPLSMAGGLLGWFAYALVVSAFSAHLASHVLPFAATYSVIFRFVAVATFVGYSLALWQLPIWYGRSVMTTVRATVDAVVYALVTAAIFGWLWPH